MVSKEALLEAVGRAALVAEDHYSSPMYLPVSQDLLDDAAAMERGLIRSVNPMMGQARLDYWMQRGGWPAFALFQMRKFVQDWK